MKKRISVLLILVLVAMAVLAACGGNGASLTLPDGKKLFEDAATKETQAAYSTTKMLFDMDMAESGTALKMKMDISIEANDDVSITTMDMDIMGVAHKETMYTDTAAGLAYFKGADGIWYSFPQEEANLSSLGGMFAGSGVLDDQSMAMLQLFIKEYKTMEKVTIEGQDMYKIQLVLDGEKLYNLMKLGMGDSGEISAQEEAMVKAVLQKLFDSVEMYYYVDVKGGWFSGYSSVIGEEFMKTIQNMSTLFGGTTTQVSGTFTGHSESYQLSSKKELSLPDEIKSATPITSEEELYEKFQMLQYIDGLSEMMGGMPSL
ncbi:hypothetical protein LJC20_01005 [Eubacteriales bacterium OttesenSCG-928-M02]|nr:hypothetical protein [Eubacteriales bacterium OttesenSCG-928-M02]